MEKPAKTHKATMRGTVPSVRTTALVLRRDMTPAERVLWNAIRANNLDGLKFRRQHPVGNFILDFYCPSCRLVVEVDGSIHDSQIEHDAARTRFLEEYGYRVIRFSNDEVLKNLHAVLHAIKQASGIAK